MKNLRYRKNRVMLHSDEERMKNVTESREIASLLKIDGYDSYD